MSLLEFLLEFVINRKKISIIERNHSVSYSITHFFKCRIVLMQIFFAPLELKIKGWLPTSGARIGRLQSKMDTETDGKLISNFVNPLVKPPPISPFQSGISFPEKTIF